MQLLLRYATGIDDHDWPLFRTCFAEDFLGDYPGFGTWNGPEEITAAMKNLHADFGATLHRITNFVVSGDQDRAQASSYIDVILMPRMEGAPRRGFARCNDKLCRTAAGWKIHHRKITMVHHA